MCMYIHMQMYVRSRCGAYDTTSYATGERRNKLESLYTGGGGVNRCHWQVRRRWQYPAHFDKREGIQ